MLLAARLKRVPPMRDDKVLADTNGMVITALINAGAVLKKAEWSKTAIKAFDFVVKTVGDGVMAEFGSAFATDNPDLNAFRAAGGKVVVWHGLADAYWEAYTLNLLGMIEGQLEENQPSAAHLAQALPAREAGAEVSLVTEPTEKKK